MPDDVGGWILVLNVPDDVDGWILVFHVPEVVGGCAALLFHDDIGGTFGKR